MGSHGSYDGKEKHVKHREKSGRRRSRSSSSDSSSSSADEKLRRKLIRKLKKLKKKEKKQKLKEKKKEKKHEKKNKEHKKKVKESNSKNVTKDNNLEIPSTSSKSYAPMTKEEWEKQQNTFRRVYDDETGRTRLVKGTGEIVEECVSRERQLAINKQATIADGEYFQKILASKFK